MNHSNHFGCVKTIPILLLALFLTGKGQAQSTVDNFDPGANNRVRAMALQADGKVVIGGTFTTLGGGGMGTTPRNYIGRLNPDGSIDTTFNPGADGQVEVLAIQADGKILVGGGFTTLAGAARSRIGRLNSDGSIDSGFDPGADNFVGTLAVQTDGKILVGGFFFHLGGGGTGTTSRNNIGRLNSDGSLDDSFDPGAGGIVDAIAVQADGKIVVGGSFSTLGGGGSGTTPRFNIGRLNSDGSVDDSFNPGAENYVIAIALQTDGKIIVAGTFTALGGGSFGTATPRNHIGRLDSNGTVDVTFDPGADGAPDALVLQSDGKILVGGFFGFLGGGGSGTTLRNNIGRLNPDGTLDADFDPGANSTVVRLIVQPDGRILVAGDFTALGGGSTGTTTRNRLGRLGTTAPPATKPLNISTRMQVLTDDNVLIGGFIVTGTSPKKVIVRAIGPSLTAFGVPGALSDPTLDLNAPDGSVTSNNNWKESQQAEIETTGLQPTNDAESAIVQTLVPGAYTAIVRGANGITGVGLVEAYDLDQPTDSKLANISTRGFIDTGDNVMIGGFIIGPDGSGDATVLVRAIGPSLENFGVANALQDPVLELHSGNGDTISTNDDWRDMQESEITATGLMPTDDRESASLQTLAPGNYTAIVRGVADTTGVGLVEVYHLQ